MAVRKPIIRVMSDGSFIRLWPAGFGVRFPTGPYVRFEDALGFKGYWEAVEDMKLPAPKKALS